MLPAGPAGSQIRLSISILRPRCSSITSLVFRCKPLRASSAVRGALGVTRQIFYVQLGSFDTHNNQAIQHSATALSAWRSARVTSTDSWSPTEWATTLPPLRHSDFGRTLTCNSNGTDHGWGSHHFVVGGAVQGQDMYGQYPVVGADQCQRCGKPAGSSDYIGRPIRRNAGALVWTFRWPGQAVFPNLETSAPAIPWIYGLNTAFLKTTFKERTPRCCGVRRASCQ